ncbi:MAG: hypothetical protein ACJAY2_003741 [Pseudomonadales bacterium]|jgi:hypothetical protein
MNNPTEKSGSKNLTPSLSELNDVEREERVRALRSMLAATEARQNKMKRVRHQTLAAGLRVQIRNGINKGAKCVILDADYIHSRVLLELPDGINDTWVKFTDVSPMADPDEEDSNPLHSY